MKRNASGQTGLTDQQFAALWRETGGRARLVSETMGITIRNAYVRRTKAEARLGISLPSAGDEGKTGRGDAGHIPNDYLQRVTVEGFTGQAVVFSDCHYLPGIGATVAHRALLSVISDLKPKLVIANGDIFDGARLSRFPRNGWENQPRVSDELEEVQERMAEVRHAYRGARHIRTIGNHCIRFDRYLSMNASEMESITGARLADHLREWQECVSVFVNSHTMIKHRFNGGIHAAYQNTIKAGTNIVTGHTHHLEVKPWGDYNGRRYGVQTGAIADTDSPAFSYIEDNPTPWCSGFAVLTFSKDGTLMPPELCEVVNGEALFRGRVIAKKARPKVAA